MRKRKKRSLKRKLSVSMIIFALILIVATGILVGSEYFDYRMESSRVTAFEYSRTAAGIVDGDRIQGYLETGETDGYYDQIHAYLNIVQSETSLKYYYVFVPEEDEIIYIWDADNAEDVTDPAGYELGHREAYRSEEDKNAVKKVMRKDPPEEMIMTIEDDYGFVGSAYSPVFNSAGEPVAIVGADISIPGIISSVFKFLSFIMLVVLGITALAVLLLFFNLNKRVISPIDKLRKHAGEAVRNLDSDADMDIKIDTGDEIEDLADSFSKMGFDLKEYIRELSEVTAERERISAELNVAAHIQEDMLPRIFPPFPDRKEFDLYATMDPAKEVGGDFYDFFMVDDDHIALVMADVAGKGIPASLFMVVSKIFIKNSMLSGMSPSEALERVNDQLLEGNNTGLFVTVWLAVIDIRSGKGVAANAGHEHPALRHGGGDYELVKYKHSPAVSTIEGLKYSEHEFELAPGDTLFVYTDGVTEAANSDNELFGDERLIETLNANRDAEVEELLPEVREAIEGFVGEAPQFDDITMMAFRYNGEGK